MYDGNNNDNDDDDDESEIDVDTEDENDESSAQGYRKNNLNKYEEANEEEVDEEGEEDDGDDDDGNDDDDDDDDDDGEYDSDKVEEVHNTVRSCSSRSTNNVDTSREYKKPQRVEHIPLYERLQKQIKEESLSNSNGNTQDRRRDARRKRDRSEQSDSIDDGKASLKRANKNAPSEMRSDRPVRRLRVTANNSVKKSLDPRFTDFSGALNEQLFSKNYSFLDEYRDSEIKILSKALKSSKGEDEKAELKSELLKMKQQSKERRLSRQVTERLEQMKSVEKDKLKQGKQPFYLKRSVVQTIGLEER
jgi:ribosomal RNA-processing protein 36